MTRIPKPARGRVAPLLALVDRLSLGLAFLAGAGLILMAVNIVIDVIGRAFLHKPLLGTLEMTTYWWMPILTLLAFAYTERRQEHIKVTILLDTLPLRMRQVVEGLFGLITVGLVLALAWYGLQEALDSTEYREATSGRPPFAIWPFKYVAVAGMAALALQATATALRYFLGLLPTDTSLDSEGDVA